MPESEATPIRTVRVSDELWQAALRKAQDEGANVSEVIREALRRYLRDY